MVSKKFTKLLTKAELIACDSDPCLFRNHDFTLYVIIYVDDFLIMGKSKENIEKLASNLSKELTMTRLGEPKTFLGIQMERNRKNGTIKISQKNYIDTISKRFNLESSYSDVPMSSSMLLKKPLHQDKDINKDLPYN